MEKSMVCLAQYICTMYMYLCTPIPTYPGVLYSCELAGFSSVRLRTSNSRHPELHVQLYSAYRNHVQGTYRNSVLRILNLSLVSVLTK